MKRVFLTKEQLSRVITNVIAEGKTTLPLTVGSNNQGYEFTTPTGPSTSGAVGEKAPNTGGGEYGPIFTDTTDKSYVYKIIGMDHTLHPNRHINKAKSKNINHADGVTRAGVTFDTKFKPGTGADPFTVKTS